MSTLPIGTCAELRAIQERMAAVPISDELRDLVREKRWFVNRTPKSDLPREPGFDDRAPERGEVASTTINLAILLGYSRRRKELDRVLISVSKDLADGRISEHEYDLLTEAKTRREAEIRADTNLHHAKYGAPRRPVYDRTKAKDRRRGLLRLGVVPEAIANALTPGEEAVATVISQDIRHHGCCSKSNAEIAQLAGCCIRLAIRTKAKLRELAEFQVIPRPRVRRRHLTTVIKLTPLAGMDRRPKRVGERRACVHQITNIFNREPRCMGSGTAHGLSRKRLRRLRCAAPTPPYRQKETQ